VQIARVTVVSLALASSVALSACGRKGDPEHPQGTVMESHTQPDGSTKKQPKKPTRPFVLDGLLN
jgi:predicted small lipoprotein YifL